MKILQVTAVDFTVEKFLLPLITQLQEEGHDVHVACLKTKETKASFPVHDIDFARNMNVVKHIRAFKQLIALLEKEKFDVVHTHTPVASMIARVAAKVAGVPCVIYTAHGFYFHEQMHPVVYQLTYSLEKYAARLFTDYVFFQSEEDYDLATKKRFKRPARLLHIGNGVNSRIFNPVHYDRQTVRQSLNIPEDALVYVFVGRQVKEKGIRELVAAFQQLHADHAHLLIVGGQAAGDRDSVTIQPSKNVHVLGPRDDIPDLLCASDVFVLPSYREGLPRSIIEAMAMKKPVIATNIRGCREEVIHEETGLLCEAKNVDDLAHKMKRFIAQPSLINQYGEASLRRFLTMYDEEHVLQRQMKIYQYNVPIELGLIK